MVQTIDLHEHRAKKKKKIFFKLINNSVFGKTMESVWKHRDIKLVAIEKGRNYLVSE